MSNSRDDTADIAWLKTLAAEGANTPPRGGAILCAAGLIWGTASVAHWLVLSGTVPASDTAFNVIWGTALVAFVVSLVVLIARLKREGGVETVATRAFGSVWSSLGWGIFSLFTSLVLLGMVQGAQANMAAWSLAIPSFIIAFYGMGWAVSATVLRQRPLWFLAIASFIAAPLLALMAGSTSQYLAYAAALYLLMGLPGFLLTRAAKRG